MSRIVSADDLQIARSVPLEPIDTIAAIMGLGPDLLEPYGNHVSKIKLAALEELADRPRAKYVLVSAVTPTPLGEGKTATSIGLAQGFAQLGKRATVAIRQPAMGPVFGIKGGAAGGGWAQVVPMERVNLHLTGDTHAVTAAHNLLAAMVDNHLFHGNALGIDPHEITWPRVLDVNDRALRNIVVGLGSRIDGVPRQARFDITAASEVMAILALATSLHDLRERLGRIVVGYTHDGEPVTAEQLQAAGAMAVILRDAFKPNLLQTLEHTPALIHAGPFGNIAHGSSSIVADLIGMHAGDYLITEAGFGADIGAEKFVDIKCRASGLRPDAAVLVATVRALKVALGQVPHRRRQAVAGRAGRRATGRGARRRRQPAQAHRDHPHLRNHAGRGDQRVPERPPERARGDPRRSRARLGAHVGGHDGVSPTAGRAGSSWPRRWPRQPTSRASSASSTRTTCRCARRSRRWRPQIYGADGVDYSAPGREGARSLRARSATATCRSASPRRTSRSRTTRSCWARRRDGDCPSRRYARTSGAGFIYPICGNISTMPGLGHGAGGDPDRHRRRRRDHRPVLETSRSSAKSACLRPGCFSVDAGRSRSGVTMRSR